MNGESAGVEGNDSINDENKKSNDVNIKSDNRIVSIDRMRGMLAVGMMLFVIATRFNMGWLSTAVSHDAINGATLAPGLTLADIFFSMFLFLVGFIYHISFKKRFRRNGKQAAYTHFLKRSIVIIGIGTILSTIFVSIEKNFGTNDSYPDKPFAHFVYIMFCVLSCLIVFFAILRLVCNTSKFIKYRKAISKVLFLSLCILTICSICLCVYKTMANHVNIPGADFLVFWGTLQNIGLTSLLALPFIDKRWWQRAIIAVIFFAVYSIYQILNVDIIVSMDGVDSSFMKSIACTVIVLVGSIVGEMYVKNINKQNIFERYKYLICIFLIFCILTPISYFAFGFNRASLSPGYIIITLTLSIITLFIFECFNFLKLPRFDFLRLWGQNAMIAYIIAVCIEDIMKTVPLQNQQSIPMWCAYCILFGCLAIITFVLWILDRKKIMIRA